MELDFISLDERYECLESLFLELFKTTFEVLGVNANALVSLSLIDDEKILEINKQYRNIDKSTDVISFAFLDNKKNLANYIKICRKLSILYDTIPT
jgi:probable rRNA maturation factor